jgi:ribonuclease M5
MKKPKIREVIVVEGRYDKNTLSQTVDAAIVDVGGFGVFNDAQTVALLRRLAETRGVILFTDPDGAGFVIRNRLKGALPRDGVKHAYAPDVYGKEKRKKRCGREGKLGVEGMRPEVLLDALRRAGATFEGEDAREAGEPITKADLLDAGLIGDGSVSRRAALVKALDLPEHISTNALLDVLNLIWTRDTFFEKTCKK